MSWLDYYHLLEKYGGDIKKATKEEMESAARGNPNSPIAALHLAVREFEEQHPTGYCYNRSGNCDEEYCDCDKYPPNPIPEENEKIVAN